MEDEKRLEILQDEIKLLKGELKNSLASVRDYLLNMELPSSEFTTILAALHGDTPKMATGAEISSQGADLSEPDFDMEKPVDEGLTDESTPPAEDENLLDFEGPQEEKPLPKLPNEDQFEDLMPQDSMLPEEEISEEIPEEETAAEDSLQPEDEAVETEEEEEIPEEIEEAETAEEPVPLEEIQFADYAPSLDEDDQGIPKVNLLANLISWVSKAKQDIGVEELPTFLEVYGISGHLTPELKDVIIRLSEIAKEHSNDAEYSEIWSQSMLSLHGILTGGEAPLNPATPSWVDGTDADLSFGDEIIEVDKNRDKSARLKLVLPTETGDEKEFSIDLTPEDNGDEPV